MPATFDKILGKPLLHSHKVSDITDLVINDTDDVILVVSTNQVLTSTSANVLLVDASAAAITITMPSISTVTGKTFKIKKTDTTTNTVTIIPNGADRIEGLSESLIIELSGSAIQLIATVNGWFII